MELAEQVTGPALQIRPGEVELQIVDQASQAAVVRRLPEVLRVLIQPGAQDRGDGAVHQNTELAEHMHTGPNTPHAIMNRAGRLKHFQNRILNS